MWLKLYNALTNRARLHARSESAGAREELLAFAVISESTGAHSHDELAEGGDTEDNRGEEERRRRKREKELNLC